MPGKIKVKVLAGRNLPVMDRASDTTDAFVEIKFGGVTHKTDVCRKSLNPHWNSTEWYRFEVDESELQDEPLQLRLMDHDTYSANDAIGKVVISLAPLLARETAVPNKGAAAVSAGAVLSGWIPVFDTMHGIRGELNVIVKVELFSDFNKYKTSSCGVQFFHCPMIPPGYRATSVHGFVEELVVNDDPEYQWIDKIRTPRASNEARQVAFIKLSNQVQRLVGLKAAELGANAVVGYQQDFDLEGEAGVVARAIGTAVSISPLPTPSYPLNVPPCSQQQLKQYLDILSTDNENVGDLNHYFSTHQDELQKLVNILHPKYSSNFLDEGENPDDDDQSMHLRRQSSIKSYTDSISIYQDDFASQNSFKSLSKDQTDLNKLLNRIDQANDPNRNDSTDSDSSGPLQTIKKIKTNFFAKKLGSLRSRKNEKPSDDQVSIKSNSSDTSRISLTDIRNEFKKFKRNLKPKKPKFRKPFKNMEDVGVGMASILARSVIHAHTSLACIAETQDSEASPSSTLRRTSESEPTINVTDEEKIAPKIVTEAFDETDETDAQKHVPEIRCASLLNINIESGDDKAIHRIRKTSESCPTTPVAIRTENFLTLPGEQGYFGSVSSALSGDSSDMYSSSEEDDESSDPSAERSIETTSSIVQTVLNQEVNPNIVAQMEKKLSVLETASELDTGINDDLLKLGTVNAPEIENNKNEQLEEASTSETFVTEKPINHHFKFHNPFTHKKSISAPSSPVEKKGSFVYRSSKRIRLQLSKLSKNSMMKSLSHYSLIPKKKHLETTTSMSQPGSSSDVPSKAPSHETVLGSPFLSYTDLMSLDKESANAIKSLYKSDDLPRGKVQMYIGSEPASRASVSGPSSPFHGTSSGLSSPFHGKDDYHYSEQRSQKRKPSIKPTGLIHTAMETLLMDKVQSLLLPTSPETNAKEKQFFADVNQKLEIVEEAQKSVDKIYPEPEIIDNEDKPSIKPTGLIHTAMETLLMDKVQSLLLLTSAEPNAKEKQFIDDVNQKFEIVEEAQKSVNKIDSEPKIIDNKDKSSIKPTGLIHTAMETLLVDKVQSLLLPTSPTLNAKEKQFFDDVNHKLEIVEEAQKSVNKIYPESGNIDNKDKVEQKIDIFEEQTLCKSEELPHNKEKTYIGSETVSRASVSEQSSPFHGKDDCHDSKQRSQNRETTPSMKPTGLIHTAMETLLIDKVQSLLLPTSPEPSVTEKQFFEDVNKKLEIDEETQKSADKIDPEPKIIDNKDKVEQNIKIVEEKCLYKGEKLPRSKEELHIGSESVSRASESGPSSPYHGTSGLSSPFHGKDDYHISEQRSQKREKKPAMKPTGLIHTAMETLLIDKVQSLLLPTSPEPNAKETQFFNDVNEKLEIVEEARKSIDKINHEPKTIDDKDKVTQKHKMVEEEELKPLTILEKDPPTEIMNEKDHKKNGKKLTRQDSVHSQTESPSWSRKMSKEIEPNLVIPCKTIIQCTPVLQNFHPILSGSLRPLETIPSQPESASIDRPQSLDIDGLPDDTPAIRVSVSSDQCSASTNCVSVCDNTHAACRAIVGRSERDKDIKEKEKDKGSPKHTRHESYNKDSLMASSGGAVQNSSLNATSTPVGMHRRSSDSDLSVTPKGSSLNASGNAGSGGGAILRPSMNSNNLDLLEYPFLTMTEYPPGFIVHLGGCVCARSVKLVDGGGESAARAAWWAELRTELRAHTRALRCNAVIAYTETTAICEDVCVLSASGTAAVINLDCDFNADIDAAVTVQNGSKTTIEEVETQSSEYCGIAHVPYSPGPGPHGADLSHCGGCRRARVPSVLLATCAKPNRLTSYAKAVTLTAVAARVRRAPPQAEPGARDISDQLPFLEYELHKLLLAKLRMQGANALFNLQTQIAIGERCVMALATGTAVRLGALPPPTPPRIKASENDKDALEMQRALWDTFTANKTANGYDHIPELGPAGVVSVTETEERPVLELCADKDAALLELDEAEDVETARFLAARRTHMQVYCNGMKTAPGKPPQAFAQVWRARLNLTMQGGGATAAAERHVARALDGITYKLRRLRPCVLMAPRFQLELPEDEIQLVLSGAAIQLQDPNKPELNGHHDNANINVASCHTSIAAGVHASSNTGSQGGQGSSHGQGAGDADDDIFTLDEEQASPPRVPVTTEVVEENKPVSNGPQQPMAVSLTSVSHISTGRCARRVCALRLLFVRETTAVRELGGLSGFLHTFTAEVMAILRAYTAALGGNALTSFYITQLMLQDNAHKNQGQCLLSVGGDVVQIMY